MIFSTSLRSFEMFANRFVSWTGDDSTRFKYCTARQSSAASLLHTVRLGFSQTKDWATICTFGIEASASSRSDVLFMVDLLSLERRREPG